MDFYKDFPERSDAGTATTPDGGIVAGDDKLNDNDYTMVGANSTGSNSQGKGYKVKFSSIYNYLKGKLLGDSGMIASADRAGFVTPSFLKRMVNSIPFNAESYSKFYILTTMTDQGCCGFVSITNYNSTATFAIYNSIAGGGNTAPTSLIYTPLLSSNISISSMRIYKRGSQNIIEVVLSKSISYGDFLYNTLYKQIPNISIDTSYAYNSSTDTNIINGIASQSLAASYIAERYSIDEEQALTRRMIANDPTAVEQFNEYNAYCEECKTRAKEELANQPQVLPADELNNQTN